MRDQSLAAGIGTPEQYVTVYSGMETEPFLNPPVPRADGPRSSSGCADEHVAVGTIARLFHLKGHDDLLDVAPDLCATVPEPAVPLGRRRPAPRGSSSGGSPRWGWRDRFILTGLVPPDEIPELTNGDGRPRPPVPPGGAGPGAAAGVARRLPGRHLRHRRQPRRR